MNRASRGNLWSVHLKPRRLDFEDYITTSLLLGGQSQFHFIFFCAACTLQTAAFPVRLFVNGSADSLSVHGHRSTRTEFRQ